MHPITLNGIFTLGRTPLDEGSASRRDLYLTTHNTHKRRMHIPTVAFELAIPAADLRLRQCILVLTSLKNGLLGNVVMYFVRQLFFDHAI